MAELDSSSKELRNDKLDAKLSVAKNQLISALGGLKNSLELSITAQGRPVQMFKKIFSDRPENKLIQLENINTKFNEILHADENPEINTDFFVSKKNEWLDLKEDFVNSCDAVKKTASSNLTESRTYSSIKKGIETIDTAYQEYTDLIKQKELNALQDTITGMNKAFESQVEYLSKAQNTPVKVLKEIVDKRDAGQNDTPVLLPEKIQADLYKKLPDYENDDSGMISEGKDTANLQNTEVVQLLGEYATDRITFIQDAQQKCEEIFAKITVLTEAGVGADIKALQSEFNTIRTNQLIEGRGETLSPATSYKASWATQLNDLENLSKNLDKEINKLNPSDKPNNRPS